MLLLQVDSMIIPSYASKINTFLYTFLKSRRKTRFPVILSRHLAG